VRKFSWRKLFLCLLVIVCVGILIDLLYQIFGNHSLALSGVTWLYVFMDIGVCIWNINTLNHYKHASPGLIPTILTCAAIIIVLSYVGVPALSGIKSGIDDKLSSISTSSRSNPSASQVPSAPSNSSGSEESWIANALSYLGISVGNNPAGTYSAEAFGRVVDTLTFRGNTLDTNDLLMGQQRFTYTLGNGIIYLTDPATGQTTSDSFEYVKSMNEVVFDGNSYYK